MKRRGFLKLTLATSSAILFPSFTYATALDVSKINFSSSIYSNNNAQTIIVYLYGGASQLAGNISNMEEIEKSSQNSYNDYFRKISKTKNSCWVEAGGDSMERLMDDGDMTIFRCCYSNVREQQNIKAHGVCTEQNQKGTFDSDGGGIFANLATILQKNGVVDETTLMPFVTMDGESAFYHEGRTPVSSYLKPVGINKNFENPYDRYVRRWTFYTAEERKKKDYSHRENGFNPALDAALNSMAQKHNKKGKIKDAFEKRAKLSDFIKNISQTSTPDLGEKNYKNDNFSKKMEAAIKLLIKNSDTKVLTLGTSGLGGWDDHNDARNYVSRMEQLFSTLESAMAHLKAEGKDQNINIMIFGDFGRNVNLNSAHGWDHGNLQNFYVLGGKGYFNHKGVVGETIVDNPNSVNRLWLKPKSGTYWFEPLSIASTIYKIYGIDNPEILTNNSPIIAPLFN